MAATAFGTAALMATGVGILVGAENCSQTITWDCWKPVIHSSDSSDHGISLLDLLAHRSITHVIYNNSTIILQNAWKELFQLSLVTIQDLSRRSEIALHASKIKGIDGSSILHKISSTEFLSVFLESIKTLSLIKPVCFVCCSLLLNSRLLSLLMIRVTILEMDLSD